MVSNQDNVEPYQHKSFHELLLELRNVGLKARDLIEQAIRQGQNEGIPNDEIRRQILEIGIPYRTMLEYIPEEMKQKQTHAKSGQKVASLQPTYKRDQSRLVIEGEAPKLPAPEQPIIEPDGWPTSEEIARETRIVDVSVTPPQPLPRKHEECFMPLPFAKLLNGVGPKSLTRLIGFAVQNGEDKITFKINNDGDLYLTA